MNKQQSQIMHSVFQDLYTQTHASQMTPSCFTLDGNTYTVAPVQRAFELFLKTVTSSLERFNIAQQERDSKKEKSVEIRGFNGEGVSSQAFSVPVQDVAAALEAMTTVLSIIGLSQSGQVVEQVRTGNLLVQTYTPQTELQNSAGESFLLVGSARVACDRNYSIPDGAELVIYRDVNGELRAAPKGEAEDGRFKFVTEVH